MEIERLIYSRDLAELWAHSGEAYDEDDAPMYHHLCQLFAREILRLERMKSAEIAAEALGIIHESR